MEKHSINDDIDFLFTDRFIVNDNRYLFAIPEYPNSNFIRIYKIKKFGYGLWGNNMIFCLELSLVNEDYQILYGNVTKRDFDNIMKILMSKYKSKYLNTDFPKVMKYYDSLWEALVQFLINVENMNISIKEIPNYNIIKENLK